MRGRTPYDAMRARVRALALAEELEQDALARHREAVEVAKEAAKECQHTAIELRRAVTRRREAEGLLS